MGRTDRDVAHRYDDGASGRLLGVLYLLSGAVTLTSPLLPTPPGFDSTGVVWVGLVACAAGAVALLLPWHRWPRRAALAGVPPAFALITVHNIAGGADPYRYSIFLLVAFVFVGVTQNRGTGLLMSPLALVAYLIPLLESGAPASALASAAYALPIFVGVAETLSWRSQSLRDVETRLQRLAYSDPLTGLANRTSFLADLTEVMQDSERRARAWVLFVDLDGFKTVNDTWGHQAGDELLREVAATLLRAGGSTATSCRWAGDEFVVLLEDVGATEVREAADLVQYVVAAIPTAPGSAVTASVGIASAARAADADAVVALADAAMYACKSAPGRVPAPRQGHRSPAPGRQPLSRTRVADGR